MLYPGAGSFEMFAILANLSKQLPTAMSKAYPKILYLFALYAITWLLPPLTYSTVGWSIPVANLPIYICPIQWLTPINGILNNKLRVRATRAQIFNGGPIPGPLV